MLKQNGLSIPQKGPSGLSPLKPAPAPQQHTPDTIGDISKGIGALKTGRDLYKDWKTPDPNAPKTTDRAAPDNPNTGNTTVGKTADANPVKTPDQAASNDDLTLADVGNTGSAPDLGVTTLSDNLNNSSNFGDSFLSADLNSDLGPDVSGASDIGGGFGDIGSSLSDIFAARGGFMRNKFADGGESSVLPYQSADNIVPNSVLQDGEDEARADQREFESLQPHGGGGGGGGGGFNPLSLVGPAVSLLSFSDKNLKHNIQEVGRTFDGQPIYKFRYKGEDSYQIGLIAQNVEKQHPNAVSKSHGLKLVNYKTATDDAAHRGHFASGGLAGNRQGYATAGGGGLLPTTDDNSASISPSIDPNAINAPQGDLVSSPTDDILNRADRAIKTIESGSPDGNYKAIGPDVKRKDGTIDNGYGAHQVMGSNIPSWTKEALGQPLTKEEFLASPEAQDATFRYHFGKNLQKFGNPQDAASVWFTGRPISQAANRQDPLGTTMPAYVAKFNKNFDNADTTDQASAPTGGLGGARYASNTTTLNDASPAPAPAPSNQVDLGGGKGFISGPTPDQDNAPSPAGKTLGDISSNAVDSVTSGLGNVGKGIGKLFSYDPDTGLTDSQLAALGFLGGMFASPNRTFLGAVGTGLGTGIESYRQLRQQEIESSRLGIEDYSKRVQALTQLRQIAGAYTSAGNSVPTDISNQIDALTKSITNAGPSGQLPSTLRTLGTVATGGNKPPQDAGTANPIVKLKPRAVEGTQENPVPASSTTAPAAPAAPTQTNAEPSVAPPAPNITDPNFLQKLDPNRNPAVLRERAKNTMGTDAVAGQKLMDQAREEENLMQKNGYGIGPDGTQIPVPNWQENKTYTENVPKVAEFMQKQSDASMQRAIQRNRYNAMSDILQKYKTGAFSDIKADIAADLGSLGFNQDDINSATVDATAFQKFYKDTLQNVFGDMSGMSGPAKVAIMKGEEQASANPLLQPNTNRAIIGQKLGTMDWQEKFFRDAQAARKAQGYRFDPVQFQNDWSVKPENNLDNFVETEMAKTAVRGGTPSDKSELKKGWQYILEPEQVPGGTPNGKPIKAIFMGLDPKTGKQNWQRLQ